MSSRLITRITLMTTFLWMTVTVAPMRFQFLASRARRQADGDDGLTTLEWVVLALGVFLAAGVAIGVLNTAVQDRLSKIK